MRLRHFGCEDGGGGLLLPFYTTNFPLTENPISERAIWISGTTTPDEAAVRTTPGRCFSNQTGTEQQDSGLFNDGQAFLRGIWPKSHRVTSVVHYDGTNLAALNASLEAEHYLAMGEGPMVTGLAFGQSKRWGYEINMGMGMFGIFIQCGRWKRLNLFDSLVSGSPLTQAGAWGAALGINDGDIITTQITYSSPTLVTITCSLTRAGVTTQLFSVTDDPTWLPTTGAPGVGQYYHRTGSPIDPSVYCYSTFTAVSL